LAALRSPRLDTKPPDGTVTSVLEAVSDWQFWVAFLVAPVVWIVLTQLLHSGDIRLSWPGWQVFATVVLVYPILEELAFRGALQGMLLETRFGAGELLSGTTLANVLTSLLFAAAHLINQPPFWAMLVFFPSLVFGYFRDRTGFVSVPIILHCWYNLGFVLLITGS